MITIVDGRVSKIELDEMIQLHQFTTFTNYFGTLFNSQFTVLKKFQIDL